MSKKKKKETLVYCGPSFLGQLQQFAVFKSGIPAYLDEHLQSCNSLKSLFVPIYKLTSTREKLKEEGSRENQLYKNILKYQKEVIK